MYLFFYHYYKANMSTYFFYENGQGKIYDEQGKDAMEWV